MKIDFLKLAGFIMILVFNQVVVSGCASNKKAELPAETKEVKEPEALTLPRIGQDKEKAAFSLVPKVLFKPDGRYYHYIEAQLEKKKGNTDKAIEHIRKAVESDPESSYLQKELANLYLRRNDNQNALNVVEKMIEKKPDSLEALIVYGKLKQGLRQMEGAKNAYEKILATDPKQRDIYLLLGGLYFEEGDLPNAFRVYNQLTRQFPNSYVGHFFIGKIHLKRGNLTQAESAFHKTLNLESDLEEPRFELLNIYDIRGKKEKVIQGYEDILEDDPDNLRAMMGLACFYHKNGRFKDAEELFEELGIRSMSDPEVLRKVVQSYVDQKKYDAAITILEGMLKGAPDNSDIHYAAGIAFNGKKDGNQAILHFKAVTPDSGFYQNAVVHVSFLYQEQGELEKAIRFLNDAIRKMPDNPEFMIYLGSFYEESGEFQKAANTLKKGLEIDPDNTRLYFRLGIVYDKWDKKEKSMEAMRNVIRLDPENANALNYLGYTYADLGKNLDEAERLVKEALKYKPGDGYIIDSLGWVYFKKGLFDKAIEFLEKAVSLVPDDPIILEHLGDAYMKINNKKKALEFYQHSLSKKNADKALIEEKIRELTQ